MTPFYASNTSSCRRVRIALVLLVHQRSGGARMDLLCACHAAAHTTTDLQRLGQRAGRLVSQNRSITGLARRRLCRP